MYHHQRIHWTHGAAVLTALAAGIYFLCWIMLAKSWDKGATAVPVPARALPDQGPGNGVTHILARTTTGDRSYFVLRNQQQWQQTRAADACDSASLLQQFAINRYAQLTPAQMANDYASIAALPTTVRAKWVQATTDAVAGTYDGTYAFVRLDSASADCVAALQAMFGTQIQKQQVADLLSDVSQ